MLAALDVGAGLRVRVVIDTSRRLSSSRNTMVVEVVQGICGEGARVDSDVCTRPETIVDTSNYELGSGHVGDGRTTPIGPYASRMGMLSTTPKRSVGI